MYIKNAIIKNIGPIDELIIDMPFNDIGQPKPLLLVGKNGTGKSIFISHIVDALYEFAKLNFIDILKLTPAAQSPYFKINGNINVKTGYKYGYTLLNFFKIDNKNEKFYYFEKSGDISREDIEKEIGQEILSDINYKENKCFKKVSNKREELKSLFLKDVFCYFPANRFEEPHWLVTDNIKEGSYFNKCLIEGYLNKDIMVKKSQQKNKDWIFNVFLDSRADLEEDKEDSKEYKHYKVVSQYNPKLGETIKNIEKIFSEILNTSNIKLALNHRNSGYTRLCVQNKDDSSIIVPSLEHLSTGQSVLLNLFITIMRYADNSDLNKSIDLSNIRGIVVIDEIELHLHSDLQRQILPKLIKLFPNVQFVITTHSPLFALGMEETFGKDEIEIRELPDGDIISSERFSEFQKAFEYFEKTETFERELNKKIKSVITEEKTQNLLIIEDEKGIEIWQKFLSEYGIDNVSVQSSNGCDNFQWEYYAENACKLDSNYNPVIYRLIDRDGRRDEDITKLEHDYKNKYDKFNFTLKCLPFYEIENILLFDGVCESLFPTISDKNEEIDNLYKEGFMLESTFRTTLKDKLQKQNKKKDISYTVEMALCEAVDKMKKDKLHLLNGKEIVKLLKNKHNKNFSEEKVLKNLNLSDYPEELKKLLEDIKKYFENISLHNTTALKS